MDTVRDTTAVREVATPLRRYDDMGGYKDPYEDGITFQEVVSRRTVAIETLSKEIVKQNTTETGVVLDVLVAELCKVAGGNHTCRYAIQCLLMEVRNMRSDHKRVRVEVRENNEQDV